jgi:hypothetical protein
MLLLLLLLPLLLLLLLLRVGVFVGGAAVRPGCPVGPHPAHPARRSPTHTLLCTARFESLNLTTTPGPTARRRRTCG